MMGSTENQTSLNLYNEEAISCAGTAIYRSSFAEPDFSHWSRMADWTLEEAASLSFGVDPAAAGVPEQQCGEFLKLQQLISRAAKAGLLSSPVTPPDFIDWAKSNEIFFPTELKRLVLMRSGNWIDWKTEALRVKAEAGRAVEGFEYYRQQVGKGQNRIRQLEAELQKFRQAAETSRRTNTQGISPKSFNTVLRLVAGMAVAIYNYKANELKSDVVSQIQSDLDLKGIQMDADTIRKWIREGSKLIQAAEDCKDGPNSN